MLEHKLPDTNFLDMTGRYKWFRTGPSIQWHWKGLMDDTPASHVQLRPANARVHHLSQTPALQTSSFSYANTLEIYPLPP